MCLAIPARVIEVLDGNFAIVDQGGIRMTVSLALVTDVAAGGYVVAHVGFAVKTLTSTEAERILALLSPPSEAPVPQ
ncbi:HypC/HybG/HupF family hydrogenase formation chaperone [Azospirillum picis]|uniref:Hydrogenase expression/formation protein HypC n=1 Tax=Azospirillum picis TaxID=488438 RepID=A0ABU0MSB5_9PROT|nr:HypC/HybG/HupF family hydrogenase formation chaperone [Azospirillum picis]MBP2302655.1 hydrogenase expression/formation protein HypC [Azospirillum picis]MDQ0536316.1 hydrogenase expression/formation protein HypC [Azospirillum picis]